MKREATPKKKLSGIAIGIMIGLPAAIICIAVVATSISSYYEKELFDKPMTAPVYDQPAYAANKKAPSDIDFQNPENVYATNGTTTIVPEPISSPDKENGTIYAKPQYTGVYISENGNSENNLTPMEQEAGGNFETTKGEQGNATDVVARDGNDISDQIWKDDNITTYNSFTAAEAVADAGGKLGSISIPSIDLSVEVYQSETGEIEAMSRGIAHFNSTSSWDGNVGVCGHNWTESGNGAYFKNANRIKKGDTITYTTSLGTRTYRVSSIITIDQSDWSYLERTDDNRLTIVTCTFNDSSKRLCIQAVAA